MWSPNPEKRMRVVLGVSCRDLLFYRLISRKIILLDGELYPSGTRMVLVIGFRLVNWETTAQKVAAGKILDDNC